MSDIIKILPNYTYDDYVHWEGRWEVIEGIPYAMIPSPSPNHQRIGANLVRELSNHFRKCSGCPVYQPLDYVIEDTTILQPDILVVCNPIIKKYLDFPPALVVEILLPPTALKDRHTKYSIYESQGIKYYVIISPDTEEAEVYELVQEQKRSYELRRKGHDFFFAFSFDDCKAGIGFKEIW